MRIAFVSQGPLLEASSLPFRCVRAFVQNDSAIHERCDIVHRSLPAFPIDDDRQTHARRCCQVAEALIEENTDVLAISLYCWNRPTLLTIADLCKRLNSEILVVAGGPDTFGAGQDLLQRYPSVDIVLERDGELPFYRLLQLLLEGRTGDNPEVDGRALHLSEEPRTGGLEAVPFAAYRNGGAPAFSRSRQHLERLDDLPSPILGLTRDELATRMISDGLEAAIVEGSRGCPINCAYCQYSKSDQGRVRFFGLDRVIAELAHIRDTGIRHVYFSDGIFTVRPRRAHRILEYFLDEFDEGSAHVEIKLDALPETLIDVCRELFQQGRLHFGVGIQTVNHKTLHLMGRPTDFDRIERNLESIGARESWIRWDLIYGLPGDGFDDMLAGIDYVHSVMPGAEIDLQPLLVLPGTRYRERADELGLLYDEDNRHQVIRTAELSARDVQRADLVEQVVGFFEPMTRLCYRAGQLGLAPPASHKQIFDDGYFELVEASDAQLLTACSAYARRISENLLGQTDLEWQRRFVAQGFEWMLLSLISRHDPQLRLDAWGSFGRFTSIVSRSHAPSDPSLSTPGEPLPRDLPPGRTLAFVFDHDFDEVLARSSRRGAPWPPRSDRHYVLLSKKGVCRTDAALFELLRSLGRATTSRR
jgi:radical SAM superfamily enzyme YgiQ (UPF0313 family)